MGSACSIKRVSSRITPTMMEFKINGEDALAPKIVFLGLDGSGKSAIITWLKRSELGETNHETFYTPLPKQPSHSIAIPNSNTNRVNTSRCGNIVLIDVAGDELHRRYAWRNIAAKVGVIMIVYIIDQCDVVRFPVARRELLNLIHSLNECNVHCSISIVINNKLGSIDRNEIDKFLVPSTELQELLNDACVKCGGNTKRVVTMSTICGAPDIQSLAATLFPTIKENLKIDENPI